MKRKIIVLLILVMLPCQALANNITESNRLFDWAERNYPDYFSPAGQRSFWVENFMARYYEDTDTYIATLGEDVFLYGDIFDGLIYVGQISDFIGPPPLQFSFSSLQPYLPVITTVGSLGYAVYQNDGEITTGLIMQALNPIGSVIKSEEYEISLLTTMQKTLENIYNKLATLESKIDELLLELKVSTDEILQEIDSPRKDIASIKNYELELQELGRSYIGCDSDEVCYLKPHEGNQDRLEELANSILASGPDGVHDKIVQIQSTITGGALNSNAILNVLTHELILQTQANINNDEENKRDAYWNAYREIENYTMTLINAEVNGVNLLVDANMYKNRKNAALAAIDMLHHNIKEIMSLSDLSTEAIARYGFIYNTVSLMLSFANPYYDDPKYDEDFLPEGTEDIFKQAEFLKRRLLNDSQPVVVVYSITEAGEEAGDIFLQGTNGKGGKMSPTSITSHLIEGRGYDNWDGNKMKYNNKYQLNIYTFNLELDVGWGPGLYYIYGDTIKSTAIEVQAYNEDMSVNPNGKIVYGFGLCSQRDSARFSHLKWYECNEDTDHRYRSYDSLMEAIDNGRYKEYMSNPLAEGVDLKTTCSEWKNHDCHNQTNEDPCGDVSICTSFVYNGDNTRNATMKVTLHRYINLDSEIYHGFDGVARGSINLYLRDEDAGTNYRLYETTKIHKKTHGEKVVEGWHYKYSDDSTFHGNIKLVPGHSYHMRLHMRASVHQNNSSATNHGYFHLNIKALEPIRFEF